MNLMRIADELAVHFAGRSEADLVQPCEAPDRIAPTPTLIMASLQVNLHGGHLPEPESNGWRHLKISLDALPGAVR